MPLDMTYPEESGAATTPARSTFGPAISTVNSKSQAANACAYHYACISGPNAEKRDFELEL